MSKILSAPDTVGADPRNITGTDLLEEGKRGLDVNVIKTTDSPETVTKDNQSYTATMSPRTEALLKEILDKLDSIDKNLRIINDIKFKEEL